MMRPRLILCGGLKPAAADGESCQGRHVVELATHGPRANVHVRLEDVAKIFKRHLSRRLEDLLEIASYVYTADCATRRSGAWGDEDSTEPWQRDLRFVVPVRDLQFWTQPRTTELFCRTLTHLSNDRFQFEFRQHSDDIPKQVYLEFGEDDDWPFYDVERVIMFSGGLDSLAGAAESAGRGDRLVLVSHRPVSTQSKRQRELFQALRSTFAVPMIHVPVWVNKDENKGREPSQRTRSFLYSALGAIIAESVRASGVRFYENGIVSLNLPVADEVLQARASRTTHPITLAHFQELYSHILGRDLAVDNPFLFMTKTEVVKTIADRGAGHLIGFTCSCSHQGLFQSKTRWHCGTCSQCIDRRVAIIASGLQQFDSSDDYVSDVFVGSRNDGYEKNMAVNYARHGMELGRMSDEEMAARFNRDLSRATRPFPRQGEAARKFIEIHRRHGQTVTQVLLGQLNEHGSELLEGTLDHSSMLAMVAGQKHLVSTWKSFAERIATLLTNGLPAACKSVKPKHEPHLQEICDGILRAHDNQLVREFPFLRWGSTATKPDWSAEDFCLWIELKYVREKSDILPITEAIAADITKYGDNERRVLYVVYDPQHLVTDERAFAAPIERRPTMLVRFIR